MSSVKFLCVDASISCTGLSIIQHEEGNKFKIISKTSLVIKTRYSDRFQKKKDMYDLFAYWLDNNDVENISFAIFENYSYGSSGHLADLGELNGMYKYYLFNKKIPFATIPPASVKKIVGGHGKASKEEVAANLKNFITNIDEITFNNTDESDSVAIGVAYAILMFEEIKKKNES